MSDKINDGKSVEWDNSSTLDTPALDVVLADICAELSRAKAKHPLWPTDLIHMVGIITEEVGEAMQDAIDLTYWRYSGAPGYGSEAEAKLHRYICLRAELVQVGAMAVRALLALNSISLQEKR